MLKKLYQSKVLRVKIHDENGENYVIGLEKENLYDFWSSMKGLTLKLTSFSESDFTKCVNAFSLILISDGDPDQL